MRFTVDLPVFPDDGRTQALKVLEEASELCERAKYCAECAAGYCPCERIDTLKCGFRGYMRDELADTLQALVNLAAAFEVEPEEIESAMRRCTKRNEDRGRI